MISKWEAVKSYFSHLKKRLKSHANSKFTLQFISAILVLFLLIMIPLHFPTMKVWGWHVILSACASSLALVFIWLSHSSLLRDRRTRVIVTAIVFATQVTIFLYAWGELQDVATFWGAVFASWVASLIFFLLIGAVATLATLARPENEFFDSRARILFRKQDGAHIDYIIGKLRDAFEHYAEESSTRFVVVEVSQSKKLCLLDVEDTTTVRSYIDDVPTTFHAKNRMWDVTTPPKGSENSLIYVRVDGVADHEPKSFRNEVEFPISTKIPKKGKCIVDRKIRSWTKFKTEKYEHEPVRFTKKHQLRFENHLDNLVDITLKIRFDGDLEDKVVTLKSGSCFGPIEIYNLVPGKNAFEFSISL